MAVTRFPKSGSTSDTLTECSGTNSIRYELFTPTLNSCSFNSVSDLKLRIPKERSNYCTIALISHPNKVMLNILHTRLQQDTNHCELPDVQAGFRKGRGTKDQIANICWIIKKESSKKTFALLTTLKPLTVWITTNYGKFLNRWEYQTTSSASWEICMQVKKQQLEPNREQTGSKLGN